MENAIVSFWGMSSNIIFATLSIYNHQRLLVIFFVIETIVATLLLLFLLHDLTNQIKLNGGTRKCNAFFFCFLNVCSKSIDHWSFDPIKYCEKKINNELANTCVRMVGTKHRNEMRNVGRNLLKKLRQCQTLYLISLMDTAVIFEWGKK